MLALAAASQKIGFVFLKGHEVLDWGLARKASHSVDAAFEEAVGWIDYYKPSRVVIALAAHDQPRSFVLPHPNAEGWVLVSM